MPEQSAAIIGKKKFSETEKIKSFNWRPEKKDSKWRVGREKGQKNKKGGRTNSV